MLYFLPETFDGGDKMSFLTLVGALLVFGFLWFFFPRTGLALALVLVLVSAYPPLNWFGYATLFILVVGMLAGFLWDVGELLDRIRTKKQEKAQLQKWHGTGDSWIK